MSRKSLVFRPSKIFIQWRETLRIRAKPSSIILQYAKDMGAERWAWSKMALLCVKHLGCVAELLSLAQLFLFTLCVSCSQGSLYSHRSVGPQEL